MSIAGLAANTAFSASQPSARQPAPERAGEEQSADGTSQATQTAAAKSKETTKDTTTLSKEALDQIGKLQARDREVRQHEQAHLAASGGLAKSSPSYTYQRGPDGVNYAIGGEVSIDVSPGRTPEETIARARIIQAAALAPADPSGPDRAVAAQAQQMEQQARGELALQKTESASQTPAQRLGDRLAKQYRIGGQDQPKSRIDLYA